MIAAIVHGIGVALGTGTALDLALHSTALECSICIGEAGFLSWLGALWVVSSL
jgi:hypothetical protein